MANKSKFLMVSLEDDQAHALANVLSNKSCRKILEHLADKQDTETGIAKALGMAASTVHYNLSQLKKGGLVEVEEFHYSKKGKVVNHYKLSNQYILIAPKSSFGLKEKLKSLLPVIPLAGGIGLALSYLSPSSPVSPKPAMFARQAAAPMAESAMADGARAVAAVQPLSAPVDPSFWATTDWGLLFFIGAMAALLLSLLVDFIVYKIKQR